MTRDRAAVVTQAILAIVKQTQGDAELRRRTLEELLRHEFDDERQQGAADRHLAIARLWWPVTTPVSQREDAYGGQEEARAGRRPEVRLSCTSLTA